MVPLLVLIGLLMIVGLLALCWDNGEKKVMQKFQDDVELSEREREQCQDES